MCWLFKWQICLFGKRTLLTGGRRFGACVCSAEHSAGLVFSTLGFTAVSQPLGGPCSTNTCTHSSMARMKFRRLMLQDPKSLAQLPDAQSYGRPPDNSTKQKSICEHGCVRRSGEGCLFIHNKLLTSEKDRFGGILMNILLSTLNTQ